MRFFTSRKYANPKLDWDNFTVYEISMDGKVVDDEYTKEGSGEYWIYVMKKINWSTDMAISRIAAMNGIRFRDIGFAGMKDKRATTYQLISSKVRLEKAPKDIELREVGKGEWIKMGDLLGNRFRICGDWVKAVAEGIEESNGKFLNYFGIQRFGSRMINVKVGIELLKGNFDKALDVYLYEKREDSDFREKGMFPEYMKHERMIMNLKTKYQSNEIWKRLPRNISLIFIHSVQSYIFNKELDMRYDANDLTDTSNLVGWNLELNKYQKEIMDELGITKDMFKMKSLPFLNAKGKSRKIIEYVKDIAISECIYFSLPSGSYATIVIDQMLGYNYLNIFI